MFLECRSVSVNTVISLSQAERYAMKDLQKEWMEVLKGNKMSTTNDNGLRKSRQADSWIDVADDVRPKFC